MGTTRDKILTICSGSSGPPTKGAALFNAIDRLNVSTCKSGKRLIPYFIA